MIVRFPGLLSGIRGITKKIMIGRKNDIKTNDCNSGNSQRRQFWPAIRQFLLRIIAATWAKTP